MNRYVMVRYVAANTSWNIMFALRFKDTGNLVMGRDNSPVKPFVFEKPYEAIEWVKAYGVRGSSVEWEGTLY